MSLFIMTRSMYFPSFDKGDSVHQGSLANCWLLLQHSTGQRCTTCQLHLQCQPLQLYNHKRLQLYEIKKKQICVCKCDNLFEWLCSLLSILAH